MEEFNSCDLKKLYKPLPESHKGQNGKLMIIGGSHLFHAAALWALNVASRIVDMVFYSSVPENNQIVFEAKKEFRDGIVVPRSKIEAYIEEADCVLIGPGMLRAGREISKINPPAGGQISNNIKDINMLEDEGEQAYFLTKYLLGKYPDKKWVIDAGALQMLEPEWLLPIEGRVILTPHAGEFERLIKKIKDQSASWRTKIKTTDQNSKFVQEIVNQFAQEYNCIVLLKGKEDIVCSPEMCVRVAGGNAGMTKGGTGDVLAGLTAALACKNDLLLSAECASYINKKAGDELYREVGYYFNSSDLISEIQKQMKELILKY